MKFATSYFYKIRFFNKLMIPLSTAMWDPKWFHNDCHLFIDKNGVINGLNYTPFNPGNHLSGLCSGRNACIGKDPTKCKFLQGYRDQIYSLDFNQVIEDMNKICNSYRNYSKIDDEELTVVFIFHEAPENLCSERAVIQDYFNDHRIECKEI